MKKIAFFASFVFLTTIGHAADDPKADLEKELADRTAGEPVRCIDLRAVRGLRVIGTSTVIAKRGHKITYRNDPAGGCPAQRFGTTIFAASDKGQRLCVGDAITLIRIETDDIVGACQLGMWTPYLSADD